MNDYTDLDHRITRAVVEDNYYSTSQKNIEEFKEQASPKRFSSGCKKHMLQHDNSINSSVKKSKQAKNEDSFPRRLRGGNQQNEMKEETVEIVGEALVGQLPGDNTHNYTTLQKIKKPFNVIL